MVGAAVVGAAVVAVVSVSRQVVLSCVGAAVLSRVDSRVTSCVVGAEDELSSGLVGFSVGLAGKVSLAEVSCLPPRWRVPPGLVI